MKRKCLLMAVLTLASCGQTSGQSLTVDELRLKDAMIRFSEDEIVRLKNAIESLRRNTAMPAREIKQHQTKINALIKQPLQIPQLSAEKAKVGAIGQLVGTLDSSSGDRTTWKVFQVVDEHNMIVQSRIDSARKVFWVTGIDTTGVTDGSYQKLGQIFEVTGTKQYGTAIGSTNTVLVFSLFSIQDADALIEKLKAYEAARKPPAEEIGLRSFRTWTDATDAFTIHARFGGIIGGKVVLVKKDGSKVSVTREQLSDADNKYLDEITKK